jgi:hypothetical protein
MKRADIIEMLEKALKQDGLRPGTSDSDVNIFDEEIAVSRAVIETALLEIEYLRAVASKACSDQDLVQIKRMLGPFATTLVGAAGPLPVAGKARPGPSFAEICGADYR